MCPSRRSFLKSAFGGVALLSFSPAVPARLRRAAAAPTQGDGPRDTILVALQLSGGNDGLNTVVPYEDDHYGRSRRTLRLTGSEVHKIGSDLGFHPEMAGFARLFHQGRLSVVQGVGYPHSDRDHQGAMRNWHTAMPEDPTCQTGWLGRAVDHLSSPGGAAAPGLFVGPIARPLGINAQKAVVPSVRSARQWQLEGPPGTEREAQYQELAELAEAPRPDGQNPLAEFSRRATRTAYATSRQVEAILADTGGAAYPNFPLAEQLQSVAQLIRADVGIRIFLAEMGGGGIGGFDNHAAQRDNHAALLRQLSEAVATFADDLAGDGTLDRVVLMTFSEFGRTLAENGRRGTGHGAAAPMFLAGGRLHGGLVGPHPDLADLDQGAPRFHTDFRRVYATLLGPWLGLDSLTILGQTYQPLDLFQT